MTWINEKAARLKQGAIRQMFDRAKAMGDVISLGIGEPDMDTPAPICEVGAQALLHGATHYTANAGDLALREAVSKAGFFVPGGYDPKTEILITTGGMGALSLCLLVALSPGDEVLIQDPQWLNYVTLVKYADGVAVRVPVYAEDGFAMTPEGLEACITSRTRVLMINSPNNPTGAVLSKKALEGIAKVAIRHDLLVISDEVYNTLVYNGSPRLSIAELPGMRERTIVINSFSKAFAMTGWRIGFAMGPKDIIQRMMFLQATTTTCPNAAAQAAAAYALTRQDLVEDMVQVYARRRELICNELGKIPGMEVGMPGGAFYVFPSIQGIGMDPKEFCDRLLEEERVVCIPGTAFGECGQGFIRISYANSEENILEAVKRMARFVSRIRG